MPDMVRIITKARLLGSVAVKFLIGAGEGNRTPVFSLGSCCSAIELHPRYLLVTLRAAQGQARRPSACALLSVLHLWQQHRIDDVDDTI